MPSRGYNGELYEMPGDLVQAHLVYPVNGQQQQVVPASKPGVAVGLPSPPPPSHPRTPSSAFTSFPSS